MAPKIDDRLLWLGLGVFAFVAARGVAHGLRHVVQLTEVHNSPPQPTIPSPKGKEDAIKTSSLATLATCSNIEISKAATKIFCDRFLANSTAYNLVLKDLRSSDPETKHRAQLAVTLLWEHNDLRFVMPPPGVQPHQTSTLPWLRSGTTRDNGNRDPEERDLRRRRREAMVINEGDRPLSQQDVWMRDGEGRMSTEERMRPRNQVGGLTSEQEDFLMPRPIT